MKKYKLDKFVYKKLIDTKENHKWFYIPFIILNIFLFFISPNLLNQTITGLAAIGFTAAFLYDTKTTVLLKRPIALAKLYQVFFTNDEKKNVYILILEENEEALKKTLLLMFDSEELETMHYKEVVNEVIV